MFTLSLSFLISRFANFFHYTLNVDRLYLVEEFPENPCIYSVEHAVVGAISKSLFIVVNSVGCILTGVSVYNTS